MPRLISYRLSRVILDRFANNHKVDCKSVVRLLYDNRLSRDRLVAHKKQKVVCSNDCSDPPSALCLSCSVFRTPSVIGTRPNFPQRPCYTFVLQGYVEAGDGREFLSTE